MLDQELLLTMAAGSPLFTAFLVFVVLFYKFAPQFLEVIRGMRKDAQEREERKIKDARSRDEFQARMLESQREIKEYMNKNMEAINHTQSMIAEQISLMKSHDDRQTNLYGIAQDTNRRLIAIEEQTKMQTERMGQLFERMNIMTNENERN